jgi:hypothetical protein
MPSDNITTFKVEIGVSTGLQEDIPTLWSMSRIYLSCHSMILILVG